VAIIRTGSGIGALQQFTSDKRQLLAAIEKVQWNPRGAGRISAFDQITPDVIETIEENKNLGDVHKEADLDTFRASVFATGTLGAVNYVIKGMKELPGRKSIMLLSDGFQLFEKNGGGLVDSSRVLRSLENLIDAANRASVVIYTMDARGLQVTGITAADDVGSRTVGGKPITTDKVESAVSDRRTELFDSQDGLVALARETGGFPILNDNDLAGGIRKVLDDQSYYLIGYEPNAETFDPKTRRFNKIEIKVNRKDTNVRYRSGFFGVTDEQVQKPVNQTAEQQILTALTSPFAVNDINLRLNTIFKSDAKKAASISAFVYVNAKDLQFSDEPNGRKKVIFDVLAISFGSDGAPVDQLSKTYTVILSDEKYQKIIKEGLVYYFTFPIKKNGAYQMRIALRDHLSGKVGSASQFIEVPNLKKDRLTLSGIALENMTLAQWNKEANQTAADAAKNPTETNPLLDTSLREFKRGTILRYGYEIYNAAQPPQLQTQTRLFRDGKLIFEGKQIPVNLAGQTDLQIIKTFGAINLGTEMQTGDYVLQVITTDNSAKEKNKIAAQFVQFEIVP
ncbi:MAG: VWA domain-containing protein, partial [Acidobacteriota bacterium]